MNNNPFDKHLPLNKRKLYTVMVLCICIETGKEFYGKQQRSIHKYTTDKKHTVPTILMVYQKKMP